jgi:tetratricopeptide (TPR) repeat protein
MGHDARRLAAAAALLAGYYLSLFATPPTQAAPLRFELRDDVEASANAFAAGRYAEALDPTRRLTERTPSQAIYHQRLAHIRHALGDRAGEAAAWERVFRTSPTPADACPMLGQAYEARNETAQALDAYERCAAESPDDPDALLFLGRALNGSGRAAEARLVLERALALSPEYPDLHLLLGIRDLADGRVADARGRFARFLELSPSRRDEVALWLERTGSAAR